MFKVSFIAMLLISSLLLLSFNSSSQIYQWKDKDGNVHYSDKRPENSKKNTDNKPIETSVYTSNKTGNKLSKQARAKVRTLFHQNEFQQLNHLLSAYQKQAINHVSTEINLVNAYGGFELNNLIHQDKFQQWINATPNNYQPYLARAHFYFYYAWDQRGNKYANKTKSSQLSAMNKYFTLAKKDIKKSIGLYPKSVLPYCLLISMNKTQKGSKGSEQALKDGLRYNSASYIVRSSYIDSLLPRWGGSYPAMMAFAEKAQVYAYKNRKIKWLLAASLNDAASIISSELNYEDANKFYTEALTFGENDSVLFKRGKNNYRLNLFSAAMKDMSKAIAIQPDNGDYYYWRSKVHTKLNNTERALQDSKKSNELNPESRFSKNQQQRLLAKSEEAAVPFKNAKNDGSVKGDLFYFNEAKKLIKQKDWHKAQYYLKKAIALSPGTFEYYLSLDFALFKLEKLDEIINYWGRYLKLKPTDDRAYLERAGTYYHKGKLEYYLKDLKKSALLGNHEAKQRYSKLTSP